MELRILGAHQLETREARLTSLLVDGRLALDAGALGRSLTLEEQRRIETVALTHRHFDHVRDLLTLGLAMLEEGGTVEVFGLPETLEALRVHLLDGTLYPDFTVRPSLEAPKYRLCPVVPYEPFPAGGYELVALPVPHGPPAVAYQVTDTHGRSLLFGGDCGVGLRQIWPHVQPHLMVLECTYSNRAAEPDLLQMHLTPAALQKELEAYRDLHGTLPRVVATHFNPRYEEEARRELREVARSLRMEMVLAEEDLCLEV